MGHFTEEQTRFLSFGPRRGATKLDAPSPTNFSFPYTPVPEGSGGPHSNTGLPANASANFKRMSTGYGAMSLSLLKFVGQASLVDDAMLPS